jgi:ATP-dependent RNA helicase RhlE
MLVLSPTRELAAQIADNIKGYAKNLRLTVDCVFGGIPIGKQARRLVPGVDILVATPGRLLDLIDNRALTIGRTEIFVLDEADQMMDLGFIHALKRVANLLPAKRQSLFFSATMPKSIEDLGKQFIKNPVRVEVAPQSTTAERVEQFVSFLNQPEKQALLSLTVRRLLAEKQLDRGIVFTRTKHGADRVAATWPPPASTPAPSTATRARRSAPPRSKPSARARARSWWRPTSPHAASTFRGEPRVQLRTAQRAEQYVHRIGRTARAGADGVAISFCAPDEKPYLRDIERLTKVKPDVMPLPENFLADAARLPAPARRPAGEENDTPRPAARLRRWWPPRWWAQRWWPPGCWTS